MHAFSQQIRHDKGDPSFEVQQRRVRSSVTSELSGILVMSHPTVAIVGAGPFGLSIAAYLRSFGVEFRIFGAPMNCWLAQMPKGMSLKSEGFASMR